MIFVGVHYNIPTDNTNLNIMILIFGPNFDKLNLGPTVGNLFGLVITTDKMIEQMLSVRGRP